MTFLIVGVEIEFLGLCLSSVLNIVHTSVSTLLEENVLIAHQYLKRMWTHITNALHCSHLQETEWCKQLYKNLNPNRTKL